MRFRALLSWVILSCWLLPAQAVQAAQAPNGGPAVDASVAEAALVPWSIITKDPSNELTADEVLQLAGNGQPAQGGAFANFGFTRASYWFSVVLDNPGASPLKRLLVVEPSWLDDVQVTLIYPDGSRQIYQGGDNFVFGQRAVPNENANFDLTLPSGKSRLLVRTQTRDPFQVGMTLWERSAFFQADGKLSRYFGLLYGAIGALLLFNLVLFFSARDKVYAAYVGYLIAFLAGHATYNGLVYPRLWSNSPEWSNWIHSITIYSFALAGLYFATQFLELRTRLHRVYRWVQVLALTIGGSFILTALGGYGLHVVSAILWVAIYAPLVLLAGVLSLMAGNRAARYFLTAAAAGFVGACITALTAAGFIPFTFYTFRALDFGMLIDAVLLSLALADRLRLSRAEAEQAKAKLIETTRTYAQKLEETVAVRTAELRQANATKDKFFSIVAHDLRGPIGSLSVMFNDVVASKAEMTDEILDMARATTKNTSLFLEELLTWARSQRGEIDCNPQAVNVSNVLLETQALFATQARAKDVRLDFGVGGACWVYADPAMVHTVLRNLTHNALKFTGRGGSVRAGLSREGDRCVVSIIDSGVGMDDKTREQIFRLDVKAHSSRGTQNESGTGLGLILCKEFVEKNGGTIGVRSQFGRGSTFWFSLPAASADKIVDPQLALEKIKSLKVLVVEDDPLHREANAKVLRDLACTPAFAANGDEAVRMAAVGGFDLILMDIDIPQIDGIEATRRIREQAGDSLIVSLSSYSRQELNRLAEGVQFDACLDKPLSKDALLGVIANLFRNT